MSEKLKPCPFCGSEYIELQGGMHPKCNECGCEQSRVIGRESVAAWSTRHIPEGYALVPVEPTQQQKHAAESEIANWCSSSRQSRHHQIADRVYRTMIAAAQANPE